MDKATLTLIIAEKFAGNESLQELIASELEKSGSPEGDMIGEVAVKQALRSIMKTHMKALTDQREENECLLEELQQTTGGGYARQMIKGIIQ